MAKLHRPHLKRRTREHIIADLSVNHVEWHALMCGFSVERVRYDYGVDLLLFTYDHGDAEPGMIFLQLKASDRLRRVAKRGAIALRIDGRDLTAWLREVEPVILILYDARKSVAYWVHVQGYFRNRPGLRNHPMSNSSVRFPAMRQFLLDLGFEERRLPEGQYAFTHHASGLVVFLPDLSEKELVPLMNFVGIRRQLDEWGLATPEEVDRLTQKASA